MKVLSCNLRYLLTLALNNFSEHLDVTLQTTDFSFQTSHFFLQLVNKFQLRVNVFVWLVLDMRSFGCVVERTYVLFSIRIAWRKACNHQTERVATQTLLE